MWPKSKQFIPLKNQIYPYSQLYETKGIWNLPHSGGNGSLGDLLSTNSVPSIKPVPRICGIKLAIQSQYLINSHIDQTIKILKIQHVPPQLWDCLRMVLIHLEI